VASGPNTSPQDPRFDDAHGLTSVPAKQFQCPECDYNTKYRTNINAHMRVHTGERPFACTECDARFGWKTNLRDHLRTHAGDKPYRCDQCGAAFSRSGTLKKHLKLHSPDGEHVCPTCGARFLEPVALLRHKRSHRTLSVSTRNDQKIPNPALTAMAAVASEVSGRESFEERFSETLAADDKDGMECSSCGAKLRSQRDLHEHAQLCTLLAAIFQLQD
jgi:uncharacterized Zn-finger protein